jgi:hypothetical protein
MWAIVVCIVLVLAGLVAAVRWGGLSVEPSWWRSWADLDGDVGQRLCGPGIRLRDARDVSNP